MLKKINFYNQILHKKYISRKARHITHNEFYFSALVAVVQVLTLNSKQEKKEKNKRFDVSYRFLEVNRVFTRPRKKSKLV